MADATGRVLRSDSRAAAERDAAAVGEHDQEDPRVSVGAEDMTAENVAAQEEEPLRATTPRPRAPRPVTPKKKRASHDRRSGQGSQGAVEEVEEGPSVEQQIYAFTLQIDDMKKENDAMKIENTAMKTENAAMKKSFEKLELKLNELEARPNSGSHATTDAAVEAYTKAIAKSKGWQWKAITAHGEEFFDLVERPEKNKDFVAFVVDHGGSRNLEDVPPLDTRYRVLRTGLDTRNRYMRIREALASGRRPDIQDYDLRRILVELAALYMVTSPDGMGMVSVRAWLAVGRCERVKARTHNEEAFREVDTQSDVSSEMSRKASSYPWYANFPLPMEYATGEAIKSGPHYQRMYSEARSRREAMEPPRSATRSETGTALAAGHRSVTQVGSAAGSATNSRPPRSGGRQLYGITGPTFVSNRCIKCGRLGHSQKFCQKPHPQYKEQQPLWLLEEMSHDRIGLP